MPVSPGCRTTLLGRVLLSFPVLLTRPVRRGILKLVSHECSMDLSPGRCRQCRNAVSKKCRSLPAVTPLFGKGVFELSGPQTRPVRRGISKLVSHECSVDFSPGRCRQCRNAVSKKCRSLPAVTPLRSPWMKFFAIPATPTVRVLRVSMAFPIGYICGFRPGC
jgi:hypothetical protein